MSEEIPNNEHAIGIKSNDPPATPEDPQAANVEIMHNTIVNGSETLIPNVWHTANVMTVIVIAAPSMLIAEPNGIEIE